MRRKRILAYLLPMHDRAPAEKAMNPSRFQSPRKRSGLKVFGSGQYFAVNLSSVSLLFHCCFSSWLKSSALVLRLICVPLGHGIMTVSPFLVIEDDEGMLAITTEPFGHSGTRERRKVLERSILGGSSGDNYQVLHGMLLERLDELRDGGAFEDWMRMRTR